MAGHFTTYHPITLFVWYAVVIGISMFSSNPVVTAASLIGAAALAIMCCKDMGIKSFAAYFAMFVAVAAVNPLFSHNGMTTLFFLNDNPVTLEAVRYGLSSAGTIIAVVLWFRSFSRVMTGEKILCLTGMTMPGLSIVLSSAIRFIPLFRLRIRRVKNTQRALGLFSKDNAIDKFRGGVRTFSIMVTWSLENAVETADFMRARGFGIGKRTAFSPFVFKQRDVIFLSATLILLAACIPGIIGRELSVNYYPAYTPPGAGAAAVIMYIAFFLLSLLPVLWELRYIKR